MSETVNALGFNTRYTLVQALAPQVIADATPVLSAAIDTRDYQHSRMLLLINNKETTDTAHYITWTVTESATSGGSYAARATSGTISLLAASGCQIASFIKNPAKPFIKVTATGSNAAVDVITSAMIAFVT